MFADIDITKTSILKLGLLWILLEACITPKDARMLKRTTRDWRDSKVVLHAWADSPFSGTFLTLRENGKFEYTSSGLVQSFEAGSWAIAQDTIRLSYVDSKQTLLRSEKVTIDGLTSTLVFEGDSTPVQMRLRIMMNHLK